MILSDVILAISKAIYKATKIPSYVEPSKDSSVYPAFSIELLDVERISWLGKRFCYHFPFVLTLYDNAKKPYTNAQKNDIALNVLEVLKLLELPNGSFIRTDDLTYRKNDGSPLIISVSYDIPMYEPDIKGALMMKLLRKEFEK